MEMDRIKKIIQLGSVDENKEWNTDGDVLVLFEDETKEPVRIPANEGYKVYEEYARQNEIDGNLVDVITSMDDETLGIADQNNEDELNAALSEYEAAASRAREVRQGIGPTDEYDDDNYSHGETEITRPFWKKAVAGGLAVAGVAGAAYGIHNHLQNERTLNNEDDNNIEDAKNININFDEATFEELMNSMNDSDQRKIVSEKAMQLVNTFHEQTHKENNFRLKEDGETYLDLSFEEAMVLTTFANYSNPEDISNILGEYELTANEAQDILESARSKFITYYMNSVEPSGLADIFENKQDQEFFVNFESEVIEFNAEHTTEASDQVIRDVYYNYILDGATNYTDVNPMAKLLAFDAVYGGLNLVESASVEHTKFLEFHGDGAKAETKYYVEKIKGLDYDSLSDEEKENYRKNIIEKSTKLVDLLKTGETMTEDNSTQKELDATASVTELVDKMGLCNEVNADINEKIQSLNTMNANNSVKEEANITTINNRVSEVLRESGREDLAEKVDSSISTQLSAELLQEIRTVGSDAALSVENYENKINALSDANRPTMQQIVNAANKYTATLDHYAGDSKDIATLINNRRHIENEKSYEADKNGYIGKDEDGIPIYDEDALKGMSDEEEDDFIRDHGKVINETTSTVTEKVSENDLTPEEKKEVEEQKATIEASVAKDNANAKGQQVANSNANSSFYSFNPSTVRNSINGEEYNLNGMSFANGVAYSYAFGGNVPSTNDSQIKNAAEVAANNYINNLSSEDKEALSNGLGSDWKSQIKSAFIDGYMSQMQSEINTAISVGKEMKATTEKEKEAIDKANKQEEEKRAKEETKESATKNEEVNSEKTDNNDQQNSQTQSPSQEESSSVDQTLPAPEEDDPNIGEQFGPGEQQIEDADGNKVREEASEINVTSEKATSNVDNSKAEKAAEQKAAAEAEKEAAKKAEAERQAQEEAAKQAEVEAKYADDVAKAFNEIANEDVQENVKTR